MGTRGYRIIKYRGRYWVFYNHWDSYLEGMGDSLVNSIPSNPEDYWKWLQALRGFYAKWDALLQTFLSIDSDHLYNIESDDTLVNVLDEAFDHRLEEFPTHKSASLDLWIEYTYTIDLHLEVFSIDHEAHYRLNQTPRNGDWIKALVVDDGGYRFVHPQLVGAEESLASLAVDNQQFSVKDTDLWQSIEKKRVDPKVTASSNISAKLRRKLFEMFSRGEQGILRVTILSWTTEDLPFREYVFYILCLAAGGDNVTFVDQRRTLMPPWTNLYRAVVCGDDPKGKRELVSSLATGFHMKDQPVGSAPPTSKYWLEGALICLVPRLDQEPVASRAIADAVRYGRDECGCASFNAILISILDVILLKCFPNGSVEYSPTMSLFNTQGTSCMNARQRYDEAQLDEYLASHQREKEEKEAAEKEAAKKSAAKIRAAQDAAEDSNTVADDTEDDGQALSDKGEVNDELADKDDSTIDTTSGLDEVAMEATVDDIPQEEELPVMDVGTVFLCLVNFFDATAFGTPISSTPYGRKLPVEIMRMILQYVADMETYNACLKVSRTFRSICNERPLIMDDVVLMDPVPTTTAFSSYGQAYEVEEPVLHDFRAMVLSSGKLMDVELRRQQEENDSFAYRYIIGTDFNRRTMSGAFAILGLNTPAPFQTPLQQQHDQPYRDRRRLWEEVTAASVKEDICNGNLDHDSGLSRSIIQQPGGEAWLLPPNTLHYFVTTNWRFGTHTKHSHFLFMLIKRGSRYWTCLWEDAIREAKDVLSSVDNACELWDRVDGKRVMTTVQALGAANPSVMLVVGTEVRLFEWRQLDDKAVDISSKPVDTSSKPVIQTSNGTTINIPNDNIENTKTVFPGVLTETEPGKIYSVMNVEDREVIEGVVKAVAERLKNSPRKEGNY
ncbi:MAG: hypothetical protein Q9213_001170 [Squamulea squamosa]